MFRRRLTRNGLLCERHDDADGDDGATDDAEEQRTGSVDSQREAEDDEQNYEDGHDEQVRAISSSCDCYGKRCCG